MRNHHFPMFFLLFPFGDWHNQRVSPMKFAPVQSCPLAAARAAATPGPRGLGHRDQRDQPRGGESGAKLGPKFTMGGVGKTGKNIGENGKIGNFMEEWWKHDGHMMGILWRNDGNMMETWWEFYGDMMETWWKHDGNFMENWWTNDGKVMKLIWNYDQPSRKNDRKDRKQDETIGNTWWETWCIQTMIGIIWSYDGMIWTHDRNSDELDMKLIWYVQSAWARSEREGELIQGTEE